MNCSLKCIECGKEFPAKGVKFFCECGGLLDLQTKGDSNRSTSTNNAIKRSGVWKYYEHMDVDISPENIVTKFEGNTALYQSKLASDWCGVDDLHIKHEGENPTGSFKDRGMTAAVSKAKQEGITLTACASTGNTSASMAAYSSFAGMKSVVFLPAGGISLNKLAQAAGFGAEIVEVEGDFDAAMQIIIDLSQENKLYPMNSLNPYRIEGQKTIIWEILDQLTQEGGEPDWIVFPAGNLGNTSAFGKALMKYHELGKLKKIPRLAAIQASGANPFFQSFNDSFAKKYTVSANTIATAINIGNPVNYPRAVRSINFSNGLVEEVTDTEILDAKYIIDYSGIGAEPASCASLAGLKKLRDKNVIKSTEKVVTILTGHFLKDTDTSMKEFERRDSKIHRIKPVLEEINRLVDNLLE